MYLFKLLFSSTIV